SSVSVRSFFDRPQVEQLLLNRPWVQLGRRPHALEGLRIGVADAGVSPGLRLPPRAGLMDHQYPARQARPLQPGKRGLRLRGMRHRDEAKTWGLAGLPLVDNIAAVDHPIGREQLAELVCSRGRGEVTDKNPHG